MAQLHLYNNKMKPTTWKQEAKNLGKEYDFTIACRMGITESAVQSYRTARDIPPYSLNTIPRAAENVVDPGFSFSSIPLSIEQRRAMAEMRASLDLSQNALAEKVGCASKTIWRIEGGKLLPSKELFCKIMGVLGWSWEVTITTSICSPRPIGGKPGDIVGEWNVSSETKRRRVKRASM